MDTSKHCAEMRDIISAGGLCRCLSVLIKCSLTVKRWFRCCQSLYCQKCYLFPWKAISPPCVWTILKMDQTVLCKLRMMMSVCYSASFSHSVSHSYMLSLAFIPFISLSLPLLICLHIFLPSSSKCPSHSHFPPPLYSRC